MPAACNYRSRGTSAVLRSNFRSIAGASGDDFDGRRNIAEVVDSFHLSGNIFHDLFHRTFQFTEIKYIRKDSFAAQ